MRDWSVSKRKYRLISFWIIGLNLHDIEQHDKAFFKIRLASSVYSELNVVYPLVYTDSAICSFTSSDR